jgi:hypothetical protein
MKKFFSLDQRRRSWRLLMLVTTLLLFFTVAPQSAFVHDTSGSSVDGSFRILSHDEGDRYIEFHATRGLDGEVSGQTIFREDTAPPQTTTDGQSQESQTFFFKADLDCLVINKGTAVMSGAIVDSTSRPYIGRRILVVAQDNGGTDDKTKKDRLTWGIYHLNNRTWLPSDSERSADEVNPMSWIATDSERPGDEGVVSNREQVIGCQSFPLASFSFVNPNQGKGTVRVRP